MEEEINLLDYWRTLIKRKWLIVGIAGTVTCVSIIYSLLATEIYKAKASIMPVGGEQLSGTSALLAQTGLAGIIGSIGGGSTSAQLVAILKSRTMAERIIEKFDLMKIFYSDQWNEEENEWRAEDPNKRPHLEGAVIRFHEMATFNENLKDKLIKISCLSPDPQLAAKIVNGLTDELSSYLVAGALTTSKRNRLFIERQLEENKIQLLEAGKELSRFYKEKGISNVDSLIDVDVSTEARGEEKIPLKKESERLQEQLVDVKESIKKIREVKDVPQQVYLQYLTTRQALLGQINTLLTQQYEMAKINEAKEDISFSVIDWARVPHQRYKPKRKQIVMIAFMMSLFSAIFLAFFMEYLGKMRTQKET